MKNVNVSIIIVNYKTQEELFSCISSIINSSTNIRYEIIVVDNDEKKTIEKDLKKKFPLVRYFPNENNGYGGGNNRGAREAFGKYFFFLNPDTILQKGTVSVLMRDLETNKELGIIAPLLLDGDKKPYKFQGTQELTPIRAIFSLSLINKFFPQNPVSRKYWLKDWDKKEFKEVGTVPGTAFMISKSLFQAIGKFDEKYFLYFEEHDICKRVSEIGFKVAIDPAAKVQHFWGVSTGRSLLPLQKIFNTSRFYYFKKHFGSVWAVFVNFVMEFGRFQVTLLAVLLAGSFIRFYKFPDLVSFIGDSGWFYLSARNMLLTGKIPFIGITASHPWLHQGPFWTYIVAVLFLLFNFNPLAPAYFIVILDILNIYLLYKLGSKMFNRKVGLIGASFYAFSPLVIIDSKIPYHTGLISFFTILYIFSFFEWIQNKRIFFPLTILLLTILYNFELATAILWFPFILVLFYGIITKKNYTVGIFKKNLLFLTFLALFIPMIPILIYDTTHGFPQTLKFIEWLGYHILRIFGYPSIHPDQTMVPFSILISFITDRLRLLIMAYNSFFSSAILLISFVFLLWKAFVERKKIKSSTLLLIVLTAISFLGFIAEGTPSDAYLPIFFPIIFLLLACFFDILMKNKIQSIIGGSILLMVFIINTHFIFTQFPGMQKGGFSSILLESKKIVYDAGDKPFQLKPGGFLATTTTGIDNYKYLVWWKGGFTDDNSDITYTIYNKKRQGLSNIIYMNDEVTITKHKKIMK